MKGSVLLIWLSLPRFQSLILKPLPSLLVGRLTKISKGTGAARLNFAAISSSLSSASSSARDDRIPLVNLFVNIASALLSVPSSVLQPLGPSMMEPPATSLQEQRHRDRVTELLAVAYNNNITTTDDDKSLFCLSDYEEGTTFAQYVNALGPSPSTYGEVTTLGARQLFYFLGMAQCRIDNMRNKKSGYGDAEHNIVFYDLGMGQGKLVIHALLELPLSKSVGVELSPSRYQSAWQAWETLTHIHPYLNGQRILSLRQGDLLLQDLSDATHIYVASLCFTSDMMHQLQEKLREVVSASQEKSALQCVATLKEFPSWKYSRAEYVEMTWTRPHGCQVYFYDF